LGDTTVTVAQLQKLSLSLSTFSRLRQLKCLYVDKTEYAYNLIMHEENRYFLSRPRRFGKSLFVSTLDEILRGHKKLFKDLWIAQSDYEWQEYGVIKLDLSKIEATTADNLRTGICRLLNGIAKRYELDIEVDAHKIDSALDSVAFALHEQFGRVALLIDEYDSPILKNLHDHEHARTIRQTLHSFFTGIKRLDEYINFVFITGVSSFAKAGLFSGMNNLEVLTLESEYAGICGYTDEELDHYFTAHMQAWSVAKKIPYTELRAKIKDWYNGYHFGVDTPSVYNPFSVMNAFKKQAFKNFWFESGRSNFLVEELTKEYRKKDYKIEFKLNKSSSSAKATADKAEDALAQIKDRKYYEAFLDRKKPILLLGIAFQRTAKKFEITSASETINV
jgi:hypothetical protein